MITLPDYFGTKAHHQDATAARFANADILLERVNRLLEAAKADGAYDDEIDPDTGTQISGSRGGSGDGGFRLQGSTTGRTKSRHKEGQAIDIYDPDESLDDWILDATLEQFDLAREHPGATHGWCHLQSVLPPSGKRTFIP